MVGRLGQARGLYMDCELDGQACRALVDTGSNITLVHPGVLRGTKGTRTPLRTAVQLRTVMEERASMEGTKPVHICVGLLDGDDGST